mmetsp:Transcript_144830/g.376862  ORF Transcript_144830/g.376862 Transcript_144830/m.376862 type:complete len:543 (-) Transcript_144830:201-1829(-)
MEDGRVLDEEELGWVLEGCSGSTPTEQATAAAPTLPASTPALCVEATLQRSRTTAEAHELAAVLSVVAPAIDSATRAPLRLVAVLDKSRSMRGDKLQLVQQTMRFMLRHLGERDQLGLVEYAGKAKVLAPLTVCDADGCAKLDAALTRIRPDRGTNLSGGLLQGLALHRKGASDAADPDTSMQQVQFGDTSRRLSEEDAAATWLALTPPSVEAPVNPADLEEAVVRSTFLFTDGLATEGIREKGDLCTAVRRALEELGDRRCTVSTFGFGTDHSASVLQGLAEIGGGIYSYVESEDQIGQAFGEALGGLLSTTHQNVQLSLKLTLGVTLARVCTDFAYECSEESGVQTVLVEAADLFAEERRDILVVLKLPWASGADTDQVLGQLSTRAFSVVMSRFETAGPVDLIVRRQATVHALESNPHVERHRGRHLATEALTAARQAARRGQLTEARRLLSEAVSTLRESSLGSSGDSTILGLIESLVDCQNDLRDEDQYRRKGEKKMACTSMSHKTQRSMNLGTTEMYGTQATRSMKLHFGKSITVG